MPADDLTRRLLPRGAQEALDRLRNRLEQRWEVPMPMAPFGTDPRAHVRAVARDQLGLVVSEDADRALHEALGAPWPCPEQARFETVWSSLEREMGATEHEAGSIWDADRAVARTVWCVARHVRPRRVVETGVARGITTRCLLEALEPDAHLWSIDLVPGDEAWAEMTRSAVPDHLRERWTYLSGSSRGVLPPLLRSLRELDVFLHDSHHTARTMRFEFSAAWPRLRAGGVLVADDVGENRAFARLVSDARPAAVVVGQEEAKAALFGIAVKP